MRLPASTESQTITALIEASVAGTFKVFGSPTLVLTPEPAADGIVARAILEALIGAGTADRNRLRQAGHHLEQAEGFLGADPDKALCELLRFTDVLIKTDLTETGPIRIEIDGAGSVRSRGSSSRKVAARSGDFPGPGGRNHVAFSSPGR